MKTQIMKYAENYNGEKIVLFGASTCGRDFLRNYEIPGVFCFCDNDPKKWGTEFCGYDVTPPYSLKDIKGPVYIVITSLFTYQIYPQLVKMGFTGGIDGAMALESKHQRDGNEDNIEKAISVLSDEESKRVCRGIIEARSSAAIGEDCFLSFITNEPVYYNNLFESSENEILIDGGAVGPSSFAFMRWVDNRFEKIYCFEPTGESCKELAREYEKRNIPKGKYELLNVGLYSENRTLKFLIDPWPHGNKLSEAAQEGDNYVLIDVVKLDDAINKATFIKMDIEGAELEAIKGAERIIREHKPKLAICLYHQTRDFWEIPLELKRICPEYRLYVRHHENSFHNSVLYAKV